HCGAGDVPCLIDAINEANANGTKNTIRLDAGTYTLTAVDNTPNNPNGLPSVTSTLTIRGAGADTTRIERDSSAPRFRLLHVAAAGVLTLQGLTLSGGGPLGEGLLNQGGTVTLMKTTVADNRQAIANHGRLTLSRSTVTDNGFGVVSIP